MANKRFIDFPIATTVGDNDIILIWQGGANKQTTKATILSGVPDSLNDLTDVTISGLTNGQILRYDSVSGQWENTDQGNLDLNDLNDVTIVSPTNGQVLVYNSSTSKWENSSGGYVPYVGAVTTVNLGAQTIQAGSFVKQGGTSIQFLKANGSVDSTAYGTGSVTSVGLTMPAAFNVANSPITTAGTLAVTGAGTVAQYIRGDGSLADFPESSGGGSSVSYYLNGSVAQGTIGGIAYKELNKVPILGAGTQFAISADGYIASFITDAGDPNLIEIPGGNWNFETYFSASSGGGSPTFYVELYKVNAGGTATLIASSSSAPELIAFGTNLTPYFSSLAVPTTTLALTDRLAVRYYVTHSGRTITLHTENNTLCQIITTFTTGLTALNGLTAQVQNFAVGTTGTDFNIASAVSTHTFNLPTASATNRGALSSADWALFTQAYNDKINSAAVTGTTTKTLTLTQQDGGTITASWSDLNTDAVLSVFGRTGNVIAVSGDYTTAQVTESGNLYYTDARSRAALSFAAGSGAYNTSTGVITIPTNNNQITNGAGYITSAALAGYLPLTGGTLTGPLGGTSISLSGSISLANNNIAPTGAGIYQGLNALQIVSGSTEFTVNNNANTVVNLRILNSGAATFISDITANRYRGVNSLVLNSYTTVNPSSNVYLYSPPNDRDAWIYLDSADTGSNWGIYHRQIDTAVSGLPPNSIGFVGGGSSTLQAWISLQTGNGYFAGNLTASSIIRSGGTSSQYLMADGSVSTLSNPVTGTGTTNYLPKFTGSTTIGNSNLLNDSNGFLYLNSTSGYLASGRIGVVVNGSTQAIFGLQTGGVNKAYLYNDGSNTLLYSEDGSGYMAFATANTEAMRIFSSRNVHIGPTPSSDNGARLQVSGAGNTAMSVVGNGYSVFTGSAFSYTPNNIGLSLGYNRSGGNGESTIVWGAPASGFNFEIASVTSNVITPRLTITSTGAATFSSSVTATSETTNSSLIQQWSYNGNAAAYKLRLNTIVSSGLVRYSFDTTNSSTEYPNNLVIDRGNVGIGVSPNTKLEVTSGNSGSTEIQRWSYNDGNAAYSLRLKQDVFSGLVKHVFDVVNNSTTYSNNLVLTNGNVGIGTSSPSEVLHLNKTSGTGTFIRFQDTAGGGVYIGGRSEGMELYAGGSEAMRITSGRNVLIASQSDNGQAIVQIGGSNNTKLSLKDGTSQNGMRWESVGGANAFYLFNGTFGPGPGWGLYNITTAGLPLWIQNSGAATFGSSVTATSFFESSDATLKTLIADNYQAKGIDLVVAKLYIKNGKEELGYFAQDLQDVLPSAVSKGSDGLLNLSYREVHTAKIAYLEERIKQLENKYEIN